MGAGTFILGHNYTKEAVRKAIDRGSLYICPNISAEDCGKLLSQATGFKHFIFANSGMEATMKAMRIARAFTGRDKIALFYGFWHGCQDYALIPYSKGIPQAIKDTVIFLPFTGEAFKIIEKEKPAMVLLEPIQSSCPINRSAFLEELRRVTILNDVLLGFDEVISGFRMSLGGARDYFGIMPDLACYGKIVGGGFPVGVIAGDEVLEVVKKGVKMGGTFSANPITITACSETIKGLMDLNPYNQLFNSLKILEGVKSNIVKVVVNGAIGRLVFTTKYFNTAEERASFELPLNKQEELLSKLRSKGVYVGNNRLILPSVLHDENKMLFIKECLESL